MVLAAKIVPPPLDLLLPPLVKELMVHCVATVKLADIRSAMVWAVKIVPLVLPLLPVVVLHQRVQSARLGSTRLPVPL